MAVPTTLYVPRTAAAAETTAVADVGSGDLTTPLHPRAVLPERSMMDTSLLEPQTAQALSGVGGWGGGVLQVHAGWLPETRMGKVVRGG